MQAINFDEQSANRADIGQFITQTGDYVLTIAQCRMYETQNKAQFIEFLFKSDDDMSLWLNVCLFSKKGEQTFDYPKIQAAMGLLGKTVLNPEPAKVRLRNGEIGEGFRCKSLEKCRIGVVVQRQNDVYEGKERHPMRLISFFDAQTRQTYHEKLNNKPAKTTDGRVKNLKDSVNTKAYEDWKNNSGNGFESPARNAAEELGEDIPF